ncbi:PREDICTED: transmembrane 4 L6 family member 18-like [Dipodomys ordii]|uniref:Transmembrane 4 L6 family member 18-like n=1 Tax=Dipodomys ordii TaxID=10020 RepID=A0A1S3G933_DIPOR|nr:PREDICTED: transmembrane 4 L6 family member 18-like [Dipodomys ordii]
MHSKSQPALLSHARNPTYTGGRDPEGDGWRLAQTKVSEIHQTLLSVIFAALGAASSGYCLVFLAVGLVQGPYCRTHGGWGYTLEDTTGRFLTDSSERGPCLEPAHVVEWNIVLFCTLIGLSGLQVIVCLVRVAVQLSRVLCGAYAVMVQVTELPRLPEPQLGSSGLLGQLQTCPCASRQLRPRKTPLLIS